MAIRSATRHHPSRKGSQTYQHASSREEPLGTIINAESAQRFTFKDPSYELILTLATTRRRRMRHVSRLRISCERCSRSSRETVRQAKQRHIERGQIYFSFKVDEKLLPFPTEEFRVYGSYIPHRDCLCGAVDGVPKQGDISEEQAKAACR